MFHRYWQYLTLKKTKNKKKAEIRSMWYVSYWDSGTWKIQSREDPGYQVPQIQSSLAGDGDAKWSSRHRSCQTYCWGFCGTDAAVARLLAASLAFPEASFTESLSSRWCVSPASTDKDTHGTWAQCLGHCWLQIQHHSNRCEQKNAFAVSDVRSLFW